jgi:hypothetical protein
MSPLRRGTIVVLLAGVLASAADSTLLSLVMPDAKMISGFNIAQAKSSPFGQFLFSQMKSTDAQLEKFILVTGFDPRYDLHEVLIASSGSPQKNQGLLLIRGSFDPLKIFTLAKQFGVTIENYNGIEVLAGKHGKNKKNSAWFAFLDTTIAVLGDPESVRGAIDRRTGGGGPNASLATRVHELSTRYDFWGVSMIPLSEWAGKVPDQKVSGALKGDVLRAVAETSGGVRFGSDIEIAGEAVTRSEKDAAALADVVRFVVGLAQLNQKDAKITGPGSLFEGLDLRTDGNVMRLSMKIPEAELEKFILAAKARQAAAKKRAATAKKGAATAEKGAAAARKPPPKSAGGVMIHSSDMGTVEFKPPK